MRHLLIVFVLVLVGGLVMMVGCESTGGDGAADEPEEEREPVSLVKASGPIGSGWYPISISIGDLWMDELDYLTVSIIEGGGVVNLRTINEGDSRAPLCILLWYYVGVDASRGFNRLFCCRDSRRGPGEDFLSGFQAGPWRLHNSFHVYL